MTDLYDVQYRFGAWVVVQYLNPIYRTEIGRIYRDERLGRNVETQREAGDLAADLRRIAAMETV
jgi:hypothetical protein